MYIYTYFQVVFNIFLQNTHTDNAQIIQTSPDENTMVYGSYKNTKHKNTSPVHYLFYVRRTFHITF